MTSSCPDSSLLDAFASGVLDAARRTQVEEHLDGCASCAEVVATLARVYGDASIGPRADGTVPTPLAFAPTIAQSTSPARPSSRPPPALPSGDEAAMLGRYRLGQRLGEGGMGVVFLAHDPELDRPVAIKLLHPHLSTDVEAQRARLVREAQAMAKLSHPNVVAVHDVGRLGDHVFVAMEYVEGTTLTAWLREERPRELVLKALSEAGEGLAAAHAVGLVHRDFKPDNVLVGKDGRARVTDFGLARPVAGPWTGFVGPQASSGAVATTVKGALVGTPAYMSPEQLRGAVADARSDQFAFAVSLYEALFRARPFAGATLRELADNVLVGAAKPPPKDTPAWLARALMRALSLSPEARFATMRALLDELGRDHGRMRRYALSGAAMLAGAGVLVGVLHLATRGAAPPLPLAASASTTRSCDDTALPMKKVWNAERSRRVEAAVVSAPGFADSTVGPYVAKKTEERLATYADEWSRARIEACEDAPSGSPTADPRVQCLERALTSMDRAIEGLIAHTDVGVYPDAILGRLQPLAACDSVPALEAEPQPHDATQRAQVESIRARLQALDALVSVGQYDEAGKLTFRLEFDAAVTSFEPLVAEVALASAYLDRASRQDVPAKSSFERAMNKARACGHDRVALFAAIGVVESLGVHEGKPQEAESFMRIAEAELQKRGWDRAGRAAFDRAVARVRLYEGRFDDARVAAERALEGDQAVYGTTHVAIAEDLRTLSEATRELGQLEVAIGHARRSLAVVEEVLGKEHFQTVSHRRNLADALLASGAPALAEEAASELATALEIHHAIQKDDEASLIRVRLGDALFIAGKSDDAEARYREIDAKSSAHVPRGRALLGLGRLALVAGKHVEAVEKFREASSALSSVWGKGAVERADAQLAICEGLDAAGHVHKAMGACSDASETLRGAIKWGSEGAHARSADAVRLRLGDLRRRSGDKKAARDYLDRFVASVADREDSEHPETGASLVRGGKLARALGDETLAKDLFGRAQTVFKKNLDASDARLTEVDALLASQ